MSTTDPTSRPDHGSSAATGNGQVRPAVAEDSAGDDQSETVRPDRSAAIARLRGSVGSGRERLSHAVARGSGGMLVLSLLVGAGAGLGAVAFRYMILGFTYAFTGHRDYSAAGHASNPLLPGLGIWFVVIAPVVGGLIYGPLVSRFAPEARGHGVPEVMLAVNRLGGRMRPQVPIVKSLASALCIGSGGSVGREGPIVQIGSALGSVLGQFVRVSESRLRLLVACGAAAGISATFNAPIAGVFFALELILRNFDAESFGFVVLSSVTADAIGRAVFGSHPFLTLPGFTFTSPLELVLYAGLGVLAVGVGRDVHPRALRRRGPRRSALARTSLAASRGRRGPARVAAARGAANVWRRLPGPGARRRRAVRDPRAARAAGREDPCDQPDDVDRRFGWRVRAVAVHGRDARIGLRRRRAPRHARPRRCRRCLRPGRDGRRVRCHRSRADHRRDHHLRAHRRLPHHPAADVRDRGRDRAQQPDHEGHDLHPQAPPPRDRHRRATHTQSNGPDHRR